MASQEKEDENPNNKEDSNQAAESLNEDNSNKEALENDQSNEQSKEAGGEKAADETDGGQPTEEGSNVEVSSNQNALPEKPPTDKEPMSAQEKARKMEEEYNALGVRRCSNCFFTTDEEHLFKVHITTCTKKPKDGRLLFQFSEGNYLCKNCDLVWENKGEFDEHVVCHISDDPYVCMSCRKHFSSRQLIEQHARQEHPTGDSRCGLRGIKKGRQFVEELERTGSLTLFGKLKIPKTPRTQTSKTTSQVIASVAVTNQSNKEFTVTNVGLKPAAIGLQMQFAKQTAVSAPKPLQSVVETSVVESVSRTPPSVVATNTVIIVSNLSSIVGTNAVESVLNPPPSDVITKTVDSVSNTPSVVETNAVDHVSNTTPVVETNAVESVSNQPISFVDNNTVEPQGTISQIGERNIPSTGDKTPGSAVRFILPKPSLAIVSSQSIPNSSPTKLDKTVIVQNNTELVPVSESLLPPKVDTPESKPSTESTPAVSQNQQMPFTDARNYASRVLQKLQSIVNSNSSPGISPVKTTSSTLTTTIPENENVLSPAPISSPKSNVESMFGIVDKDTGKFERAPIPSSIQKVVIPQTSQKIIGGGRSKSPQYHVKHITEYTTIETSPTTSTATFTSSQPVYLIPVGPVFHPMQQNQNIDVNPLSVNNHPLPVDNAALPNKVNNSFIADQLNSGPTSQTMTNHSKEKDAVNNSSQNNSVNGVQQDGQSSIKTQVVNQQLIQQVIPHPQQQMSVWRPIQPNQFVILKAGSDQVADQVAVTCTPSLVRNDRPLVQSGLPSTTQSVVTASLPTYLQPTVSPAQSSIVNESSTVLHIPVTEPPGYKETIAQLRKDQKQVNSPVNISIQGTNRQIDTGLQIMPPKNQGTRYMFRIKPGNGFVCEACRKFTKDELIYKNHIWNHFHLDQRACQSCTPEEISKRYVHRCKLVNSIVCNLIKRCSFEIQKMMAQSLNPNEVISISDDEDDQTITGHSETASGTEVIVLDEEDNSNGLQIRIDSTCTISEADYIAKTGGSVGTLAEIVVSKEQSESHVTLEARTLCEKLDESTLKVSSENNIETTSEVTKDSKDKHDSDAKAEVVFTYNESDTKIKQPQETNLVLKNQHEESIVLAEEQCNAFYMCAYEHCSFTAFSPNMYKAHLREHHLNEYNFICCHCGLKDYTVESHIRHMNTHASAKSFALYCCPVRMCSYKSNLLHYYACHLNAHRPEDVNLKCTYCHKLFETTEKLQNHLKTNILEFVNCNYCSFKFGKKHAVLQHIRNVHKDKPRMVSITSQIVCLEREINFYNPPLAKTRQSHVTQDRNETESLNIPAIMEQLQKESGASTNKEEKDDMESVKSTDTKTSLQISDERNTEKKKGKSKNSGPKSLVCPQCNYLSYNLALHNRHIEIHEQEPDRDRRFVCNFCPTATDYIGAFRKHMANHLGRNEIKVYSCTMCHFNTNLKSNIMDHCDDNHGGSGMYTLTPEVVISSEISCKFCTFKSRQADQVVMHEKLVHASKPLVILDRHVADQAEASQSVSSEETAQKPKEHDTSKKYKYHCEYCSSFFKHKVQLVNHLEGDHGEIDDKTFTFYKCKYCPLGSTRKELIVTHLDNEHIGQDVRILRKIEKVQSKSSIFKESPHNDIEESKEEVAIPDGNVFKSPFNCPKCAFSTLMRISAMRHLKEHPDLKAVREKGAINTKKTARKTTSNRKQVCETKGHTSLFQKTANVKENPFTAVKEAVNKLKESEKDVKSTYNLGDKDLHVKLSAYFTPVEKDIKFKCKICKQDIVKKFVLHRHILDHLSVIFFKCQYCEEGSVEKTLLFGHIQKTHPQQPLLYHQFGKEEVDVVLEERILKQEFSNTSGMNTGFFNPQNKKEVYDNEEVSPFTKNVKSHKISKKTIIHDGSKHYWCTYEGCKYNVKRLHIMERHLMYHGDKTKDFKCNQCDYRHNKQIVYKHIKRQHDGTIVTNPVKIEEMQHELADSETKPFREGSVDSVCSVLSGKNGEKYVKNTKGEKIKYGSLLLSNNIVYEMRKVFKCKDCGEKKDSISSIYKHLQTTKCKRPAYRCSLCSFQRYTKVDIARHAKIRHPGKKLEVLTLPRSSKFKSLKIPIKHSFDGQKAHGSNDTEKKVKAGGSAKKESGHCGNTVLSNGVGTFDKGDHFICGLCHIYKSDSLMKLQFHINTVHDGQSLHCQECSYKTPLIKHMINHCKHVHLQKNAKYGTDRKGSEIKGEKDSKISTMKWSGTPDSLKFKCTMCSAELQQVAGLRLHYYKHFNYKPFICDYCSRGFPVLAKVKYHIESNHPEKSMKYRHVKKIAIEKKIEKIVMDSKQIKAREMKKILSSPKQLSKKRSLEYDSDTDTQQMKQLKVGQTVNKTVLEEGEIKNANHSPIKYQVCLDEKGTRIFKCSRCPYTSTEKHLLKKHMSSHGARFFKCFYCSFSTKIKGNALRHCKRAHKDRVPKIIDKKTSTILNLDDEHKQHDSGLFQSSQQLLKKTRSLRYNCCICRERIDGLDNFEIHLSSHSEFQDTPVNFDVHVVVTNCNDREQSDNNSSGMDTSSDSVDLKEPCAKLSFQCTNSDPGVKDENAHNMCSTYVLKSAVDGKIDNPVQASDKDSSIRMLEDSFIDKKDILHDVSNCIERSDYSPVNNDRAKHATEEEISVSKIKQKIELEHVGTFTEQCEEEEMDIPEETVIKPSDINEMPLYTNESASPEGIQENQSLGFEVNETDETDETESDSALTVTENVNICTEENTRLPKESVETND